MSMGVFQEVPQSKQGSNKIRDSNKLSKIKLQRDDIDFISDSKKAILSESSPWSNLLLYSIIAFLIAAIIWANFAYINQVTVAMGKVIPSSQAQVIRESEGGILEELFVSEGSVVKEGQKLLQISKMLPKQENQQIRTITYSHVNGIVKKLYTTTIGSLLAPGTDILEIVPQDSYLLVEANVKASDIAFIRLKQSAFIKVTAYDYTIYGGLNGFIESISPDSTMENIGNKEESFYQIRVRSDKNYLEKDGQKLEVLPGMTVVVDILGEKRSVLDYMLKPIMKTKQQALREH